MKCCRCNASITSFEGGHTGLCVFCQHGVQSPSPAPPRPSVLEEAGKIVAGARRESYGPVRESFQTIADVWSVVLKRKITAEEVSLCMIGLKLCREANKHQRDNLVDLCGYSHLLDCLHTDRKP